jgi:lipopolysaccharide export system protein LptA
MLKKLILPILVLSTSFININALDDGDVRIEANLFEANDRERVSIFSGSVKITKGKDVISSSIAKIYFDKKNQPLKYEFLDNVSFKIHLQKNSTYVGSAEEVYLIPKNKKYILSKSVEITEIQTGRKITGNKISLDGTNGSAKVIGDNKSPVIMSFTVGENQNERSERRK